MNIPTFQQIMLPLLKFANDEKDHTLREAIEYISSYFNISEEDRRILLPSGVQPIIDNRVSWANTFLKKAGLLESPKWSYFRITNQGLKVLSENPSELSVNYLKRFPQFKEFSSNKKSQNFKSEKNDIPEHTEKTPQEVMDAGYQEIRNSLAQELIGLVKQSSPRFFEQLVVELLLAMGYGGSRKEAGKAVGQTGDGGIDGIINEDKLGLDVIYIQAKRWENSVGSKDVRNFVGSLIGNKANKGVFITTSSFTRDALEYVKSIAHKVILIDGEMLTQLMIEHNVGVTKVSSYEIKKIDTDYFAT